MPVSTTSPVYSPARGSTSLPLTLTLFAPALRSAASTASSMNAGWPSSTTSTLALLLQKSAISSGMSG